MIVGSYDFPVVLSIVLEVHRSIAITRLVGTYERGRTAGAKVNVISYGVTNIRVTSLPEQSH